MGKVIYSMITSLDGYAEAAEGGLGTGAEGQEVHTFINDLFRPVGTYPYGRRMEETLVFWETAHTEPDLPPHIPQYAQDWKAAERITIAWFGRSSLLGEGTQILDAIKARPNRGGRLPVLRSSPGPRVRTRCRQPRKPSQGGCTP